MEAVAPLALLYRPPATPARSPHGLNTAPKRVITGVETSLYRNVQRRHFIDPKNYERLHFENNIIIPISLAGFGHYNG